MLDSMTSFFVCNALVAFTSWCRCCSLFLYRFCCCCVRWHDVIQYFRCIPCERCAGCSRRPLLSFPLRMLHFGDVVFPVLLMSHCLAAHESIPDAAFDDVVSLEFLLFNLLSFASGIRDDVVDDIFKNSSTAFCYFAPFDVCWKCTSIQQNAFLMLKLFAPPQQTRS